VKGPGRKTKEDVIGLDFDPLTKAASMNKRRTCRDPIGELRGGFNQCTRKKQTTHALASYYQQFVKEKQLKVRKTLNNRRPATGKENV